MNCSICSGPIMAERLELGYSHCLSCAEQNPVLSRPEYGVVGQHKGPPLVISINSPEWQSNQSYMRKW
jgi:hypothetical protein